MAEGDTVHRAARRLGAALEGSTVVAASAPNPRAALTASAVGSIEDRAVERVEAHGKHLLIRLSGALVVHSHLGMNGSWDVGEPGGALRRPRAHAWLVLETADAQAAQFGGPTLRLISASKVKGDPVLRRLGPDPLRGDWDRARAVEVLARAGQREIGEALLDQTLISGVGNIYKSEACHAAQVDPRRRVSTLGRDELEMVVEAAARQLADGLRSGRRPGAVYRRDGRPCPRCGARIRWARQGEGNRSTFWCPGCQRG